MASEALVKRARVMAEAHEKRMAGKAGPGRPPLPATGKDGSRRVADIQELTTRQIAANRSVVVEARMRRHGITKTEASKQEWGHVLGQLRSRKKITEPEFKAGKQFGEDMQSYYSLTGIPHPSAKAQNVGRVKGIGSDPKPERVKSAANAMMILEGVIGRVDTSGRPVRTLVARVCVMDQDEGVWEPHMLKHLVTGLRALAFHYGMQDEAKKDHPF